MAPSVGLGDEAEGADLPAAAASSVKPPIRLEARLIVDIRRQSAPQPGAAPLI